MFQKRRKLEPVAIFLLVSILIHIGFCISLLFAHTPSLSNEDLQQVEITYDNTPTHEKLLQQIVEQQERLNKEKDAKAKYMSKFDQKVEKETKAKNTGKFNNTVAGGAAGQPVHAKKATRKQAEKKVAQKGELPTLRDLSPTYSPTPQLADQQAPRPGEEARTDDYLKDVKTGLQTILTTREFVYYTYYSRIKEKIGQYWEPNVREKVKIIYRQGRTIASAHDRVTQLLVVLDKEGNLIRVEVLGHSGVEDLDDAAVGAFQSAAPFPNPPKGMIEHDGTIKIRWDFILES